LIVFDLDGTLVKLRPTSEEAFLSYCADLGLDLDGETRRRLIRWSYKHWADNRALITNDEKQLGQDALIEKHLQYFLENLDIGAIPVEQFSAHISARFRDDFSPVPYLVPGVKDLLRDLKNAGLKLGLVSNRDEELSGAATEMGIIKHFDFTLAAGQVGSWKPDPTIFQHALRLGGDVPPQETVYVGDNYYADVVGARGVGMVAVLIDEHGAFPEAQDECVVISHLGDLRGLLPGLPAHPG
jgi:HAD superfamily hydrolase (TIGR01509 family)